MSSHTRSYAVQLKPVGSFCNIACEYCYAEPFKCGGLVVMSDDVLEKTIAKCMSGGNYPTITWHGGEPLIPGLSFFEKALKYAHKYGRSDQVLRNVVQTNATLVTSEFARFFHENGFEVGVSLDGPSNVHGIHRKTKAGENTFDSVMRGVRNLRDAGINPSVICTVTKETLEYAREVFAFLVSAGFNRIKYSPVYDAISNEFSLPNENWFAYLKEVFDLWFDLGNADIQVRELDEVISWVDREPISMCSSNRTCINWVSVDPLGNLYPCEYLRSDFLYGNIMEIGLADVGKTPAYRKFRHLALALSKDCVECEFVSLCGNGCPATRMSDGEIALAGKYVYCKQRRMLYNYIAGVFGEVLSD